MAAVVFSTQMLGYKSHGPASTDVRSAVRRPGDLEPNRITGGQEVGRSLGGQGAGRSPGGQVAGRRPGGWQESRRPGGSQESMRPGGWEKARGHGGQQEARGQGRRQQGYQSDREMCRFDGRCERIPNCPYFHTMEDFPPLRRRTPVARTNNYQKRN